MFYIQTQDGDLPYTYKVYVFEKAARKYAFDFMGSNHQAGMISLCTSTHETLRNFFREEVGSAFTEEVMDPETGDLVETKQH